LFQVMWEGLSAIPGVTVYGPPPDSPRTSTVSFSVADQTSDAIARSLADRGLFLSDGDFYAQTAVERLGVGGLVRAGLACYTTADEVDRLTDGLRVITS
jgi:selenocysteine lyase/cysteine desulfurase